MFVSTNIFRSLLKLKLLRLPSYRTTSYFTQRCSNIHFQASEEDRDALNQLKRLNKWKLHQTLQIRFYISSPRLCPSLSLNFYLKNFSDTARIDDDRTEILKKRSLDRIWLIWWDWTTGRKVSWWIFLLQTPKVKYCYFPLEFDLNRRCCRL